MRNVVIATANSKLASGLNRLLQAQSIKPSHIIKSAAELSALNDSLKNSVVIMGFFKDTPAIYAARTVPDSCDVILLLDSNSPVPYYISNITVINLPIENREFIEIVLNLCGASSRRFGTKSTAKKKRSEADTKLIESAKKAIMKKRGISESDAHRLLQKYAMNAGVTLTESAKHFLDIC